MAAFVRKPQIELFIPTLHHPVRRSLGEGGSNTPAQSSLIKPNRAISCLDAIQSQPPSCSKVATSPILLRQSPSKPVKVFSIPHHQRKRSAVHTIYCGTYSMIHNLLCFAACGFHQYRHAIRNSRQTAPSYSSFPGNPQSANRNPQFQSIPLISTYFHFPPPPRQD